MHAHALPCLKYPTCSPRWETSNPILLSFQFHPLSLSCRAIKKRAGEGWETLERRKISRQETDEEHTSSLSLSWRWSASSFLHLEVKVTLFLGIRHWNSVISYGQGYETIVAEEDSTCHQWTFCIYDSHPVSAFVTPQLCRVVPDGRHSLEWISHCVFTVSTDMNSCFLKYFLNIF